MNRRELFGWTLAGGLIPSPLLAKPLWQPDGVPERLRQGMIWCRDLTPVALEMDGQANGIADINSQAGKHREDFFSDYHGAFTKTFDIEGAAGQAELFIFAYTRYRLYINGAYVGRGPNRYQNERPEFDAWPVTRYLYPGRNRVCVLVHRDSPTGRIMYHAPGFTALIAYTDHTGHHIIPTDESWRARPESSFLARKVAWASIEEHIDARLTDAWTSVDYDDRHWPVAAPMSSHDVVAPQPRTIPLLRETRLVWNTPFVQTDLKAGDSVELAVQFPTLAYHRIAFTADAGSQIEIAYNLPESQSSGRSTYIAREGAQVWEGGDTFAFTRLTIKLVSGRIRLEDAQAFQVLYPFERIGSFSSNDPMLNDLWSLCARSLEVLSEDAYVDCADRERVEWTDETPPAFECTRVMMAGPSEDGRRIYSDPRLLKALLQRIALTQKDDGQIKAHSCSERWDIHAIMEDRSCDWVIALRQYYDATGDRSFVRELWPTVNRLLNWFIGQRTARGLVLAREWEVWDNPLRYQLCEGAGLNAFVYHALVDGAYLGHAAGFHAQANAFTVAASDLSRAFNDLLWDDHAGAYFGGLFGESARLNIQDWNRKQFEADLRNGQYRPTLQAALFALDAEIVPAARRDRLLAWILAHHDEAHLCMSHHFLFKALYQLQSPEADTRVLELMRSKWKPMVSSPWGTSWEGLEDWGGSKIHIYGIVPGYFLSSFVLGVRVDGPVRDRKIIVEPRPGDLQQAEGIVVTELGTVPIVWRRVSGDVFDLSLTVPEACQAHVRLPLSSTDILVNGRKVSPGRRDKTIEIALRTGRYHIRQVTDTEPVG